MLHFPDLELFLLKYYYVWRFLYQNFIKIGLVVKIFQDFEVKANFLSMAEFSIKIVKESILHVKGLVWKKFDVFP